MKCLGKRFAEFANRGLGGDPGGIGLDVCASAMRGNCGGILERPA